MSEEVLRTDIFASSDSLFILEEFSVGLDGDFLLDEI